MVRLLLGDCLVRMKLLEDSSVDSLVTDPPAGISFMGKAWDDDKGGRDQWQAWMTDVMKECLRVMKPGAHGLVWAIPRTSHWTATALENAGFEIRDVVTHLFGTGFPKSLDVSKAIDKAAGAEREILGPDPNQAGRKKNYDGFAGMEGKYAEQTEERKVFLTAPATDAAKQWQGWGTALKPASEHWILIRKPCSEKTVAANVLKWGTGALNIDASRVEYNSETDAKAGRSERASTSKGQFAALTKDDKLDRSDRSHITGRFPANLVLDEQAAVALDAQNTGGASRFFYVAKASKSDKGESNTHPTVKSTSLMEYLIKLITPPAGVVLDPFMGSGSTGKAAVALGMLFVGIEKEKEYFEIAKARIELKQVA